MSRTQISSGPYFITPDQILENVRPFTVDNIKKYLRQAKLEDEAKVLTRDAANEALKVLNDYWLKADWLLIIFAILSYMVTSAEYKIIIVFIMLAIAAIVYTVFICKRVRLKRLCEGISLAW